MIAAGFRSGWFALAAAVLLVVAVEFAFVLSMTNGQFTYTLDDPYIHLALAENLARFGHYGINLQDYSSPSSSILWPLLLVPLLAVGLGLYAPLILNVAFAVATVLIIHRIITACAASSSKPAAQVSWIWALLIFLAANGIGLIFTGMEHSLQVLVTVSVLFLVIRMQLAADHRGAAPGRYSDCLLVLCVVLSPLVRFEGLAIAAFGIVMLVRFGKLKLAMLSALLIAAALGSYFFTMWTLGLPWLPSSVLVKSSVAADVIGQTSVVGRIADAASHALGNLVENLESGEAQLLLLVGLAIAALSLRPQRSDVSVSAPFAVGVLAVIGLHFIFGRFGWYGRYQSYVFVFAVCAMPYLFTDLLFGESVKTWRRALIGAVVVLSVTLVGFLQHLVPLITTPIAAQNIYQHQRQMHEFAVRYWKAPVAVTDIGYVSFQNDQYVLDLWGLGSEEARKLNQTGRRALLPALAAKHGVNLAMISDRLISDVLPPAWHKIAVLELTSLQVTSTDRAISFYVFGLDRAQCLRAADQIAAFKSTLAYPQSLSVDAAACDSGNVS